MRRYYANTHLKIAAARTRLESAQCNLQADPLNLLLFDEERNALLDYEKWMSVEEQILKQESKIHWLKCGDGNNISMLA